MASLYDSTIQQLWYFFKKYCEIFSLGLERNWGIFTQYNRNKGFTSQGLLTSAVVNCELLKGIRGPYFTLESLLGPEKVTFDALRVRLVQQVKLRINNGEFTERGLSRILGISQSQTHNVLKGARSLQIRLADQILSKLGLSAMDLFSEGELEAALRCKIQEWDPQPTINDPPMELLGEQVTPKKPVGRTLSKADCSDEQTG